MKNMLLRTCLLGLATLALAPAPARACSTTTPPFGLAMQPPEFGEPWVLAADGVIAFPATISGMSIEEALAGPTLSLLRDGEAIATTPTWVPLLLERGPVHIGVVVWRPDAALTPGAYTVRIEHPGGFAPPTTSALEISAAPLPPLTAAEISGVFGSRVPVEALEFVCCERGPDSCGSTSECHPSLQAVHPAVGVEAAPGAGWAGNAVVWLAPVLPDGTTGPRVPGTPAWWRLEPSTFLALTRETVATFAAAQDSYCVVVGATSLIDGAEVVSPPRCVAAAEIGAPAEEPDPNLEPLFDELFATCDGPPTDDEGRVVGRGEGGCRTGQVDSPWALLVVLLALRRRRR